MKIFDCINILSQSYSASRLPPHSWEVTSIYENSIMHTLFDSPTSCGYPYNTYSDKYTENSPIQSPVCDIDTAHINVCRLSCGWVSNMLLDLSITFYFHYNIWGCMCSSGPFQYRWLKRYFYSSCYYDHQIGSIHLSHCFHIFPWLCAWDVCHIIFCHLFYIHLQLCKLYLKTLNL